ncbi:MAG: hypothetical protein C0392_12340 [Syntrophus sp. (in: bacteria)]|nr:hypothetical protein [Syntrophus sp. (in: bacteria)]
MRDTQDKNNASEIILTKEALKKAEERYLNIFKNAVVGIYQSLPCGRYINVNPVFARILGYGSPDEVIHSITDIRQQIYANPDERSELMGLIDEKGSYDLEFQIYTKDRTLKWISNSPRAVRDENGNVAYYEGFVQDITDRKHAEEELIRHRDHLEQLVEERTAALKMSEKRYRDLVENVLVGVYQTSLNGEILYANNNFLRIFGFETLEEMMPSGLYARYKNPKDREAIIELLRESGRFNNYELELLTKSGETIHVLLSATLEGSIISGMMLDISERKRSLDKLRESEIKYRTLFDNANDAIFLIHKSTLIDCNQKAVTMFGYPKNQIIGHTFYEFVPPCQPDGRDSKEKALEKTRAALSGEPQPFEWRYCRSDGTFLDSQVSLNSIEIEDKIILQAIVRDVSDRKKTEDRLRVSEEKYRSIFENAVEGIFQTTPEGTYITVNPALAKIFGYASPQVLIDSISDIAKEHYVHSEDRERLKKLYETQGFVEGFETQVLRRDGNRVWVLVNARAVKDRDGKTLYYEGTLEDITSRREMEDALKKSEERYRTFIDSTSDMVFLKDEKLRNIIVNKRLREFLKKSEEEIIGKTDFNLMPPKDARNYKQTDIMAIKSSSIVISEHTIGNRTYESRKFPINLGENEKGVGGFVRDITERKKAEEELKVKSRSLEEVNAALRVLLKQRDQDKNELEEKILYNVKKLVLPYVERLKERKMSDDQKTCLDILETNLKNIISPFVQKMVFIYSNFTATEILVANFIRDGKTIKEIAKVFRVSENAVNRHRQNIRNKLGLNKQKVNLKAYLMSMK